MSNPYGADVTGAIYNGATACPVKFAQFTVASTFGTQVVAAVSGKKIRVLSYVLVTSAANTLLCFATGSGSNLTGNMVFTAAGQGVSAPYSPVGHFETVVGEMLQLYGGGAAMAVAGHLSYIEVSA